MGLKNLSMRATGRARERTEADSRDRFIDKNFPTVYRFAFCMSLGEESAAALTESTFAQAERAHRGNPNSALDKRWLLATAHHEWQEGAPRSGDGASEESAALAGPLIASKHVAELDQAEVLAALHWMREELRLTLSLFYFEQLSYGEISAILEIPPVSVLAHLAEAKTVLRRRLETSRKNPQSSSPGPRVSLTKSRPRG